MPTIEFIIIIFTLAIHGSEELTGAKILETFQEHPPPRYLFYCN